MFILILIVSLLVTIVHDNNSKLSPQVSIQNEGMVKRQYHTATAIAISSSQVVVVVFGGLDEFHSGDDDRQQPIKAATCVLEFGN